MEENTFELVNFDAMKRQVAEAKDIETLQGLSNKLEAIRILAKQSKQSLEVQNNIAEYRLRVEKKKGEWLQENIQQGSGIKSSDGTRTYLKDIGLSWDDSSRAQMISRLPDADFEKYIQETKETNKEITLNDAVRMAKQIIREDKIDEQIKDLNEHLPEMPEGEFEVIVIDPPWKYDGKYDPQHHFGRMASPYPEMSQDELLKMQLPTSENCVLWLWTTNTFLRDAFELVDKWGFAYKNILTWDKVNIGVGYWMRGVTEHCILAVKGSPIWTNKTYTTLLSEKRTEHSKKPEGFYKMVDEICYGRKIEIFSRTKREGWEVYGDEIEESELSEDSEGVLKNGM